MSPSHPEHTSPLAARPGTPGIDPRGPRFGAAITGALLLVVIVLGLIGSGVAAFILLAVVTTVFAWGSFAGLARHPYGLLFKALIRPRLSPPAELEDPAAPTFAQIVGFVVTAIGLVLALFGLPFGLVIAAAAAFVAAFLNSVFGYCIGCQMYLLLVRAGLISRRGPSAA